MDALEGSQASLSLGIVYFMFINRLKKSYTLIYLPSGLRHSATLKSKGGYGAILSWPASLHESKRHEWLVFQLVTFFSFSSEQSQRPPLKVIMIDFCDITELRTCFLSCISETSYGKTMGISSLKTRYGPVIMELVFV